MTIFAKHTHVSVEQTRGDIQSLLGKYHASPFSEHAEPLRSVVEFDANGYQLRFYLPLPHGWQRWISAAYTKDAVAQDTRSRWRALHLCIKAKLESIESGIATFEHAFWPDIVGPDGLTMAEKHSALLPKPKKTTPKYEIVTCRYCGTQNRIPIGKHIADITCGNKGCRKPLASNAMLEAHE